MDTLAVGIIRTSHGVRGYLKVKSLSGETAHFFHMKKVNVRTDKKEKEYGVEDVKPYKDGVLLKLEGVDTPEKGKSLAGAEIWVEREAAAPCAEDEFYISDLHGARLIYKGKNIGRVVSVGESGLYDLLEVDTGSGTRLVPFSERYIGTVDLENGTIELLDDEIFE